MFRLLKSWHEARFSLRQHTIHYLSSLALITIFLGGGAISLFTWRAETDAWRGRQGEAAHSAAQTVLMYLLHSQDVLAGLGAINPAVFSATSAAPTDPYLLENLLRHSPAFMELARLDAQGNLLASASASWPMLRDASIISQADWFQAARSGQVYRGALQFSAQNEPYMILAMPAPDGGVVAGKLRMDVLQDVVATIRFGQAGRVFLFDQTGAVIAHTSPQWGGQNTGIAGRPEYQAILNQPGRNWYGDYISLSGEPVVGVSAPVAGTSWVVVTELPQTEAFAGSRTSLLVLAAVMLLMVFIIISFSQRELQRILFAPLEALRRGVEQIGRGNLDYRIGLAGRDEIGEVARAVDRMAASLQDRERELALRTTHLANEVAERQRVAEARQQVAEELQRVNAELEARVLERTSALERENAERRQAETDLRHNVERLLLLNRVIAAGASTLEPKHILEILCMELAQAIGLKQASFALLEENHASLTVIAEYRTPDQASALGNVIPIAGNPPTQQVLENRRPAVMYEVPLAAAGPEQDCQHGAVLLAPMIIRDQVIGTLALGALETRAFSEEDIALVQFVTTAAGQIFDNARLYAELQRELVERIRVESQLHYQSTHDILTDLYNRSYFEEEIGKLERQPHFPVGVMMIDVDHMKEVNDTLGHAAGDEYLRQTARLLRRSFRSQDMVARIGGDEFAVFLPETDEAGLELALNRVRQNMRRMPAVGGLPALSLSLGGATARDAQGLLPALHRADTLMYQEKSSTHSVLSEKKSAASQL